MKRYPLIAYLPNPAHPRSLRPAAIITDRAKRYRANASPPAGPRRCNFCTSRKNIDVDHIDGDEARGDEQNLIYLCRSCNTRKGITQSRANVGKRTRQYNPQRPPTYGGFLDAVFILRGDRPGDPRLAAATIQATPPAKRIEYGDRIEAIRKSNPAAVPSFAQYAAAVAIHRRKAHDEGGKVIHATPPAKRSEYARKIAAGKRAKRR